MPERASEPVDGNAPTCARCGYDLRGAWLVVHRGRVRGLGPVGGLTTCPECGTTDVAVAFGWLVASRRSRREIIGTLVALVAVYAAAVAGAILGAPHLGAGFGLLAFFGAWVVANLVWLFVVRIVGARAPLEVMLAHAFLSLCAAMLIAAAVLA